MALSSATLLAFLLPRKCSQESLGPSGSQSLGRGRRREPLLGGAAFPPGRFLQQQCGLPGGDGEARGTVGKRRAGGPNYVRTDTCQLLWSTRGLSPPSARPRPLRGRLWSLPLGSPQGNPSQAAALGLEVAGALSRGARGV